MKTAMQQVLTDARNNGATHISFSAGNDRIVFAYRPAPAYPNNYGQKVYIMHDDTAHTREPWILCGNLPANAEPIPQKEA